LEAVPLESLKVEFSLIDLLSITKMATRETIRQAALHLTEAEKVTVTTKRISTVIPTSLSSSEMLNLISLEF
jgi:hypothetical protein